MIANFWQYVDRIDIAKEKMEKIKMGEVRIQVNLVNALDEELARRNQLDSKSGTPL
jgi:hypothetical protein